MIEHNLNLAAGTMRFMTSANLPTLSKAPEALVDGIKEGSLNDKIEITDNSQNESGGNLRERLIFVSPPTENSLEDASNEGCNI